MPCEYIYIFIELAKLQVSTTTSRSFKSTNQVHNQARNQDLMRGVGGANKALLDQTTEMYF